MYIFPLETYNESPVVVNEDGISYEATTVLDGWVESQFSFDEYRDSLRVATTIGDSWDEDAVSRSNVYVLNQNLETIGSIKNIAPGERIYSVRFSGDKGYVVTYKEVDPLFVIDLSNPQNPQILGELKIPGFSEYLHMYDDDHVIGIGYETEIEEQDRGNGIEQVEVAKGLKLSLFDVSDPSNPKELHTQVFGGAGARSDALYEHKGFTFDKEKELLVIPAQLSKVFGPEYDQRVSRVFDGALVFNVRLDSGFTEVGKITHLSPEEQERLGRGEYVESAWEKSIDRSLYMDDYLYTISDVAIKVHKLWDIKELYYNEF
jgi:uncharacterized secreted protein with C-terminal beta-propeller domain